MHSQIWIMPETRIGPPVRGGSFIPPELPDQEPPKKTPRGGRASFLWFIEGEWLSTDDIAARKAGKTRKSVWGKIQRMLDKGIDLRHQVRDKGETAEHGSVELTWRDFKMEVRNA